MSTRSRVRIVKLGSAHSTLVFSRKSLLFASWKQGSNLGLNHPIDLASRASKLTSLKRNIRSACIRIAFDHGSDVCAVELDFELRYLLFAV